MTCHRQDLLAPNMSSRSEGVALTCPGTMGIESDAQLSGPDARIAALKGKRPSSAVNSRQLTALKQENIKPMYIKNIAAEDG